MGPSSGRLWILQEAIVLVVDERKQVAPFRCPDGSDRHQQANLIPGLNLNALGIFSTGLSVLPPAAAGPRGAASTPPAGYGAYLAKQFAS
ncbi:hypothetical protein JZ751_027720 [Albula glossodonta]|uniref:Uncharacterized protein n=1 Tax=Albula glossodonta TaxID=121402 RepID=A0A8T2PK07_9TELE|nr:hypothetical protein JZ751_027720 [Albula glossodonta]